MSCGSRRDDPDQCDCGSDAHPLLREAALKRVAQVRLESLDGNNANSYKVVRIPVRFELESLNARVDTAHIAAR